MCQVAFEVPNAVLYDTKMSVSDTIDFARRATALLYYTSRGVSLGYCAEIAGMDEADFILFLGQHRMSIFEYEDEEELAMDIENALRVAEAVHGK